MNTSNRDLEQQVARVAELARIIARLHDPQTGCTWCIEQTHATMRNYAIDEGYEVAEAIDSGDPARLADELGDLLILVLSHAAIAQQHGAFDLADVAQAAADKEVRRNPHIFGNAVARTSADVLR